MKLNALIPIACALLVSSLGGCQPPEQPQNLTGSYTLLGSPRQGECEFSEGWRRSLFERFEFESLGSPTEPEIDFISHVVTEDGVAVIRSVQRDDEGGLDLQFDSLVINDDDDGNVVFDSLVISLELFVEGIDVIGEAEIAVERDGSAPCLESAELDGFRRPLVELKDVR